MTAIFLSNKDNGGDEGTVALPNHLRVKQLVDVGLHLLVF